MPAWMVFPIVYAGVFLSHWGLLHLPYFWDEAGYYIPAAYDFFRTGTLIPFSTLTNAHPPLPSIYLAFWWKLSGFFPAVTRLAICLVTALALTGVFALCRKLMNAEVAVATTLLTASVSGLVRAEHAGARRHLCRRGHALGAVLLSGGITRRTPGMAGRDLFFAGRLSEGNCHRHAADPAALASLGDAAQARAKPWTSARRLATGPADTAAGRPGTPTICTKQATCSAIRNSSATTPLPRCTPCALRLRLRYG